MKSIFTFCILLSGAIYQAQTCSHNVLNDDFSSANGWTVQSASGSVSVTAGALNFNNASSGQYNTAYKGLITTVSNTYWKAECDFQVNNTNPTGNGAGAVALALTAGNLDFIGYDASQSFAETNQDGIGVVLFSQSAADNDMNNWYFLIEQKKGNVRTYSSTRISADPSTSNYYIRLERLSASSAKLSVYANAGRTIHMPGSPITYTLDPTISGLNTIQHGTLSSDDAQRLLSGSIDNDLVCDNNISTYTCSQTVFNDNFSSSVGWVAQSASGEVAVSSGACTLNNAYSGQYNRIYKGLPVPLSDNYWKAESDFHINSTNPSGNGAGAVAIALTAGNLDFIGYDASQGYAETNQDGIAAVLLSQSPTDNNMDNWYFLIEGKQGNVRSYSSAQINASASINDYFLMLERTGPGMAQLSVFSDAAHTNHLLGSPITFTVSATLTGLNTVQHGALTTDNSARLISGTIDNDAICDDQLTTGIKETGTVAHAAVYPNPFSSYATIQPGMELVKPVLKIMDVLGQEVAADISYSPQGFVIQKGSLREGIYTFYILSADKNALSGKLIVE